MRVGVWVGVLGVVHGLCMCFLGLGGGVWVVLGAGLFGYLSYVKYL